MNGKRHIRLDQGRKLATAIAISSLVILGFIGWQISGASNQTASKAPTARTSSESSTQPTAEPEPEASEVLEDPNPKNLPAGNIWTYNCEIPVQLPESFYLTCADGGWYVYNIKWQSWGKTEAKATAMYSEKVCEPDCADGYRVEAPVNLTISTLAMPGNKIYLTNLVMKASTEKNFQGGNRSLTWDLGEFAKLMASD
ncbi:hypothetical protein MCEMKE14_00426 [Candidatus Nanopelagicaceae bacterium]